MCIVGEGEENGLKKKKNLSPSFHGLETGYIALEFRPFREEGSVPL